MSQLFASGDQSIGASASASVLPMKSLVHVYICRLLVISFIHVLFVGTAEADRICRSEPWREGSCIEGSLLGGSWVFIGRTDVEAESPVLWPPDAKG